MQVKKINFMKSNYICTVEPVGGWENNPDLLPDIIGDIVIQVEVEALYIYSYLYIIIFYCADRM